MYVVNSAIYVRIGGKFIPNDGWNGLENSCLGKSIDCPPSKNVTHYFFVIRNGAKLWRVCFYPCCLT